MHDFVKVYLDDVIIHSALEAEHLDHLDKVSARLAEYSFYTKLHKFKIVQWHITFLGHVVDEQGIHIMPEKVKSAYEWLVP